LKKKKIQKKPKKKNINRVIFHDGSESESESLVAIYIILRREKRKVMISIFVPIQVRLL
jgi:hypothetical protein